MATSTHTGTQAHGYAIHPNAMRVVLLPKTRQLLAVGVRMGTIDGDTGREHGPEHPVEAMERKAYRTPCPCEGSPGHLRQDFAWEIVDTLSRVRERGDLSDFVQGVGRAEAIQCCIRDAIRALVRWTAEDAR